MDDLALRISAIFIIFIASILGISLPFVFNTEEGESDFFLLLKTASAGVMLGLALLHLLPDAQDLLSTIKTDYPVANALTALGIISVLFMEQITFLFSKKPSPNQQLKSLFIVPSIDECSMEDCRRKSHDKMINDEQEILSNILNSNSLRDLITAYVMEISIAVHSIIIGVDLGLLGQDEITTLVTLVIALSFHQCIEGIGLGTSILSSRNSLGNAKIMVFVMIFSSTMPLGIVIGILMDAQKETQTQTIIKGIANAIAAGSLMFISLTEMIGHYFDSEELNSKPLIRVCMILAFGFGVAFMALIATWA